MRGTNLQILSIVGVVELLAWQIVIARGDAQNIKGRLRNSNFGLVIEVGIGEINNKSPQPVYAVSVDRHSADLTADDSYEITNRLNSVFRRRLKQSESGADHIGAQKKTFHGAERAVHRLSASCSSQSSRTGSSRQSPAFL
jgi:hypothetical protein